METFQPDLEQMYQMPPVMPPHEVNPLGGYDVVAGAQRILEQTPAAPAEVPTVPPAHAEGPKLAINMLDLLKTPSVMQNPALFKVIAGLATTEAVVRYANPGLSPVQQRDAELRQLFNKDEKDD